MLKPRFESLNGLSRQLISKTEIMSRKSITWDADRSVINRDPFEDISVLKNPETSIAVIIKDGEIVKNIL